MALLLSNANIYVVGTETIMAVTSKGGIQWLPKYVRTTEYCTFDFEWIPSSVK